MGKWIRELDRILRGDATRLAALERGTVEVTIGGLCVVIALLGVVYGACMGSFALFREGGPFYMQVMASMLKVPALFFLTLLVTFPSLYVFNALVGSRLGLTAVLRLLIASLGVNLAVLASLGPIVAFFSVSTTSYAFMVLLNVVVFSVAGFLGLNFLLQTLHRLTVAQLPRPREHAAEPPPRGEESPAEQARPAEPPADATEREQPAPVKLEEELGALDRLEQYALNAHVKAVFRCWVIVFGLVGAQMGWVLRPFVGNPNQPFEWFRPRESNFLQAVLQTIWSLFI